jgi:hypothetical protein
VSLSDALILQGQNVGIMDADVVMPHLGVFSTRHRPTTVFQPTNMFRIRDGRHLGPLRPANHELHIFLDGSNDVDPMHDEIPVYESRTDDQFPLEGRLFWAPMGGLYRKARKTRAGSLAQTDWVFERRQAELGQIAKKVLEGDWSGLDHVQRALLSAANSLNQEIDYLLLSAPRGRLGIRMAHKLGCDGVVMVSDPSRDSLSELTLMLGELPPDNSIRVRAILINRVSDTPITVDVRESGTTDLIAEYVRATGLEAALRAYSAIDPPSGMTLNRAMIMLKSMALTDPRAALDRYEAMEPIVDSWQLKVGGTDKWDDLACFKQSTIPIPEIPDLSMHSRPIDIRTLAWRTSDAGARGVSTEQRAATSVAQLAAHLRARNAKDFSAKALLNYLDNQPIHAADVNWQNEWYRSLSLVRQDQPALATSALADADNLQRTWVYHLPPIRVRDEWPGDWRLHTLVASLRDDDPTEQMAQLEKAAQGIRWQFRGKDGPCWSLTSIDHNRLQADLSHRMALALSALSRYEEAHQRFLDAFRVAHLDQAEKIAVDLTEFILSIATSRGHGTSLHVSDADRWAVEFAENELAPFMSKKPMDAVKFVVPFALLRIHTFRRNPEDPGALSALENTLKRLREWATSHTDNGPPEDNGYYLLGLACIETVVTHKQSESQQEATLADALIALEKATILRPASLLYHVHLALVRLLRWHLGSQKFLSGRSEDERGLRPGTAQARSEILQRDAFYAFEQACAILGNEGPDKFFNREPVKQILNSPVAAMQALVDMSPGLEPCKPHMDRWLSAFMNRANATDITRFKVLIAAMAGIGG